MQQQFRMFLYIIRPNRICVKICDYVNQNTVFRCGIDLSERMVLEMKIIKEELQFEESLKKRLEFICEFSKVTPTFINGSIRKIDKTNISYIEPHRVIIKNITFLVFNYSNDAYISNLVNKIRLSELEEYLKKI